MSKNVVNAHLIKELMFFLKRYSVLLLNAIFKVFAVCTKLLKFIK